MDGPDTPPPDPRLIEAQIRGIDKQNSLIDIIMKNSADMAPLQKEQLQQALDAQRTAMQQSQEDRQWMLGRRGALTGLQNDMIAQANTFDTEGRRQQLASQAMGDVNQAFDNTRGQGLRAMTRMGVNPNDGRMSAFNAQTGAAQALAMSTAANKTREAARQEGYNMKSNAANLLAGYPAQAMAATGQAAGFGMQGLNVANSGLAGMNSGYGMALQGAGGMTNSATSAYGTQANAYNQAAAAENQGIGSIIGAGAMLGAAAMM